MGFWISPGKSASVDRFEDTLDNEQTGKFVKLAITCKGGGIAVRVRGAVN